MYEAYYDVKSPACFSSVSAVLRECKKRDPKVTRKQVEEFLAEQETYTRHRQLRRRFKRNVIKSPGIDVHWQGDLADMRNVKQWNNNYTYLLVCVDVLSRYAFVAPIKKKTPERVSEAFASLIKKRKPWTLTTDRGLEFSKKFQDFLASQDIEHRYATSPDVKCAIAERYIRTLKGRIWKYFTTYNTNRYIDVLPDIVNAINNSHHRTLGQTPASVNKDNQTKVWHKLYDKKPQGKVRFKAGDKVRISLEKHVLTKGYRPNYSSEVFTVSRLIRQHPPTYKIKDDDEELEGVFYNEELVKVLPSKSVRTIQTIKKSENRDGELWHLVKYTDKRETWIRNSELVSI